MKKGPTRFIWSDGWILLAIIYANRNGFHDLKSIIKSTDYINHAIPTYKELLEGLKRLQTVDLINIQNEDISATDLVVSYYNRMAKLRRPVMKEVDGINKFLGTIHKKYRITTLNATYKKINKLKYNRVVKEYLVEDNK